MRAAVRDLDGLPVLVTEYERALADPVQWCEDASAWLRELGLSVTGDLETAATFLDQKVRKHAAENLDSVVPQTRSLYLTLQRACDTYASWRLSAVNSG